MIMADILLSQEFSSDFTKLQKRVERGDGEAEYVMKLIERGIAKLVENHEAGQKIHKTLWPKQYIQKYGITNLWRLRLDNYWRMLYTIMGDDVRVVAVIIDVMNHGDYDRKFGYK